MPWPNVHLADAGLSLPWVNSLYWAFQALSLRVSTGCEPAGGPDLQRLVVVAAEDVERVRRRDRDLRLLLRRCEDRLHREAEILGRLLCDVRDRELDAEAEHPQRAGELAARVDVAGAAAAARRASEHPAADGCRAGATPGEELARASCARARPPPSRDSRVAPTEILPGRKLLAYS